MRALRALLAGLALAGLTTLALSRDISTMTGAGTKLPSGSTGPTCASYVPAAYSTSAIYIDWTVQAADGSWGMACLSNTTSAAVNTLGSYVAGSGSAVASSAGLTLTVGGSFQFSNVTWLTSSSGTIYVNMSVSSLTGTQVIADLSNGGSTARQALQMQTSTLKGSQTISGTTNSLGTFIPTINTLAQVAYSYTSGAQIVCANAGNNATAAVAGSVAGLNTTRIGLNASGTNGMGGVVTAFAFFAAARANTAACDTIT